MIQKRANFFDFYLFQFKLKYFKKLPHKSKYQASRISIVNKSFSNGLTKKEFLIVKKQIIMLSQLMSRMIEMISSYDNGKLL